MDSLNNELKWEAAVGRVAMSQGQVDEAIMQLLIELINPQNPEMVEILVGGKSLSDKCKLLKEIIVIQYFSILPKAIVEEIKSLCTEIKNLDSQRNRVVHSYYSQSGSESRYIYRSRSRRKGDILTIADVDEVSQSYSECFETVSRLVEDIPLFINPSENIKVNDLLELSHQLVSFVQIFQSERFEKLSDSLSKNQIIYFAVKYPRWRVVSCKNKIRENESLITIDIRNGAITIQDESLPHTIRTINTGWRDITGIAQTEDPLIEDALIRRVGDSVEFRQEGGTLLAKADEISKQSRIAQRCFPEESSKISLPEYLINIEGFSPYKINEINDI